MNGYECPCCGSLIPTDSLRVMRGCPKCKADADEQREALRRRAYREAGRP